VNWRVAGAVDTGEAETTGTVVGVPRLNQAGKTIRRVLEWLLNREVPDAEIGSILGLSKATYSRRKDADDFPSYAELATLGEALGISPRVLQIAFGWRGQDELVLLDIDELGQYHEQAGQSLWSTSETLRRYIDERGQLPPAIEHGTHPLAAALREFADALKNRNLASDSPIGAPNAGSVPEN